MPCTTASDVVPCTPVRKYRQDVTGQALGPPPPGVAEPEQCCGRLLSALQYHRRHPQPPDEGPDTDIRQPRRPKGQPTVTTPSDPHGVGARQSYPTRRPRGRDGTPHLLKKARAWPTKIDGHATSDTVCHDRQGRRGEEGRLGSLEGPSTLLVFFPFPHL